ncbi:hypothetical protein BC938DRAFT_476787, partial [Jimgerdemannia flammicorona]
HWRNTDQVRFRIVAQTLGSLTNTKFGIVSSALLIHYDGINFVTQNRSSALDIIHFVKEHASLRTTLAGIDVLIKRHHSQASIKIDYVDFERIYVVKFHILATVDLGDSGDENEESLMQLVHSSFAGKMMSTDLL